MAEVGSARTVRWTLAVLISIGASVRSSAQEISVPAGTPCPAPAFEKIGEFTLPPCDAPADATVKVSGRVIITNRSPAELKQALLLRKIKMLAAATATASAVNPGATELSFEYSEPASTYQPPVSLVVAPQCGPVLSISVDRKGRCP